ncbi:MAG: LysM peptidoglycan-binding domain-containing protein [Peptococcaceae bacterium]|nr:LysM peptidoglycan-binding domain-containing protein [Candidatus Syntrophopropionicum ammoniitolerans]
MPNIRANQIWSQTNFNNPVRVSWRKTNSSQAQLVAAAGNVVYLFVPAAAEYTLSGTADVGTRVLSLAVGRQSQFIVVGTADRLIVFTIQEGMPARVFETEPEPGAFFVDLAIADIDGDGREEVIAASEGKEALYIYRQPQAATLELLAIRILPGPSQKVAVLDRGVGNLPLIVAAYKNNSTSGLLTLLFTERGFVEGPEEPNLPASVMSLTTGRLRGSNAEEGAWGGGDGALRIVGVNDHLDNILTSNNLGSFIPALTTGMVAGESRETLVAGSPGGFLFGFKAPVVRAGPDWAVNVGRPIFSLVLGSAGLLGVGTSDGSVQVWQLTTTGDPNSIHVVSPGETLYTLALHYQTTVGAIARLNKLTDTDLIYPGQILTIP